MKKNWRGSKESVFKNLSATNHSKQDRQCNDYYATDPKAVQFLMEMQDFNNILEPACGEGHISQVLKKRNKIVTSSDLIYRGYGLQKDFFDYKKWDGDIITNPPYIFAQKFVEHSLKIIPDRHKIAMFLKIQFLQGKARRKLFEKYPPKIVYISSSRMLCAKNGIFPKYDKSGKLIKEEGVISDSAVCYCWFVWVKDFKGDPIIKWFN